MSISPPEQQVVPFELNIVITDRNEKPCIELRKVTTDPAVIKSIISCAYHGKPIIVLPVFKDTMKSLGTMIEKGIVSKGEDDQYYFNF